MTKQETQVLLAIIGESYSKNFVQRPSKELITIWHTTLKDLEYKAVYITLVEWLATEKYPPTIADIRSRVVDLHRGKQMTANEGWGILMANIKTYGLYRQDEGLKALPIEVKRVVNDFGYREYCVMQESENSIKFAQFRDAFNEFTKEEKLKLQRPKAIQKLLEKYDKQVFIDDEQEEKEILVLEKP